jgi:multiple sugar transport system substrate-binding protein
MEGVPFHGVLSKRKEAGMTRRRHLGILALAVVLLCAPALLGAAAPATLRVMWWGDQTRADITNKMLQLFASRNSDVAIQTEFTPFSGYFDKLNTQLASGTAPDMFTLGSNILDYAIQGVLLNMRPYVVGGIIRTEGISSSLMDFNTIDGRLCGVSIGANSRGMLANTAMFQKAGVALPGADWSWDDFVKIANTIAQKLGSGYYGTYDNSGQNDPTENFLKQNGQMTYDMAHKSLGFTADTVKQWWTLWDNLRKSGGAVPPDVQVATGPPNDVSKSLVPQGKVAMVFMPTNQLADYQKLTQDKLVLLPVPRGPKGSAMTVESSQNICAWIKTKYPGPVARVVDFWVNEPDAAKILGNNRGVPVSASGRAALKESVSATDKIIYDYHDLVSRDQSVKATYNIPGFNEYSKLLSDEAQSIAFGKASIDQAVQDYLAKLKQILAANLPK